MKEILAIIRPNKIDDTKKALDKMGIPEYTTKKVIGRGKEPVDIKLSGFKAKKTTFLPKRAFWIVVSDEDEERVVQAIMDVNSTGNQGDGKIFVMDSMKDYTVSTKSVNNKV